MCRSSEEIGGYLGLDIPGCGDGHYHSEAIKLNTARNALEYLLSNIKVSKLHIPYYNCSVLLEPIIKTNTAYDYYEIDNKLELSKLDGIGDNEYILYVNYFGIKNLYVEFLILKYGDKLIVDNSQSFFSQHPSKIYAIYSPRKFFGVPDGGYLMSGISKELNMEQDTSIERIKHLVGRVEYSANDYYEEFKRNEKSFKNQKIKKMSKFTNLILSNLNYQSMQYIRDRNFCYVHTELQEINRLNIDKDNIAGALAYPFLYAQNLKNILIKNKIYVATYWKDVLLIKGVACNEMDLVNNLIPLPIDHRYDLYDMKIIVETIKANL